MPKAPDFKRLVDDGVQFTEKSRSHIRQLASELVSQGQLTVGEVSGRVDEFVQASRHHADELRQTLGSELQRQLNPLGRATKQDLATQAELAADQMSAGVEELVRIYRQSTDELRQTMRCDVQRELDALGLVTREDLAGLEGRVNALGLATRHDVEALEERLTQPSASSTPELRADDLQDCRGQTHESDRDPQHASTPTRPTP